MIYINMIYISIIYVNVIYIYNPIFKLETLRTIKKEFKKYIRQSSVKLQNDLVSKPSFDGRDNNQSIDRLNNMFKLQFL